MNATGRIFISLLLLSPVLLTRVQAQQAPMTQTTRDVINLTGLKVPTSGGTLYGFDNTTRQVVGDAYLDTTFAAGNIHFYGRIGIGESDSLMGVPIRLDLMANELEIRATANDVRVAGGDKVRWFDVNTPGQTVSRFVNVRQYRGEADGLKGFFDWVMPGKIDLMQYNYVHVKKADYNAALNVGSRDEKILKKADWYVLQNGQATKFSPGKKALLALMADKQAQIEQFLKVNSPDLKTRQGLMAVFAHYNQL